MIQDIKDLLFPLSPCKLEHTLREENHSADFMAKLGVMNEDRLRIYSTPPSGISSLLVAGLVGVEFPVGKYHHNRH